MVRLGIGFGFWLRFRVRRVKGWDYDLEVKSFFCLVVSQHSF